mmetsp:Transcript_47478/g.122919  ORF Transcript_47478/g.122919 Transcript_47478/m.122919 type:complete len:104 (-) Transcript_47478:291-602(-)
MRKKTALLAGFRRCLSFKIFFGEVEEPTLGWRGAGREWGRTVCFLLTACLGCRNNNERKPVTLPYHLGPVTLISGGDDVAPEGHIPVRTTQSLFMGGVGWLRL